MANEKKDTKPVRAAENLDWRRLEDFIRAEFDKSGAENLPPDFLVEQFSGGHSNLTYLIKFGAKEFVMRRPPFGKLPPKAHDVAREFHLLEKIHPVYDLAPQVFFLCEDAKIIGAPFYLMERRRGIVIRQNEPPEIAGNAQKRGQISRAMVAALSELHRVDINETNLVALGKPANFVERQVGGWTKRWHAAKTEELPAMEKTAAWLAANLPPDAARPTLVHGDFKLDNVMLDGETAEKIVGVFDWEMCAVGDPLIDLGILLCYWVHLPKIGTSATISTVTQNEGWFNRDEILAAYAQNSTILLDNIAFYEIFAVFKLAVVLQQIYYRFHQGATDDARFAHFDSFVRALAKLAESLIE